LIKPLLDNDLTSKEDICKWLLAQCILVYTYSEHKQHDYREFNDFFLLHGVTSCYGLTEILLAIDFSLDECRTFVYDYLNALIACWITQDMPTLRINNNSNNNQNEDDIFEMKSKLAVMIKKNLLMKDHNFSDEHVYKLIQVTLECLSRNIIDIQVATDAITKSFKPFEFDPAEED